MSNMDYSTLVEQAAASLGEHFDAVQILVTLPCDGGGTKCIKKGCGNWYARQGMAHEFIKQDEAADLADQIGRKLDPPDPDDDWKQKA